MRISATHKIKVIEMLRINRFLLVAAILFCIIGVALAQQPSPDVSAKEQEACRSDAIRHCFFRLANAEALRGCLRANKPSLSPACQKLLTSRGN